MLVTSTEAHRLTEMLNQLQVVELGQVEDHKVLQLRQPAILNPLHPGQDQTLMKQITATFLICPTSSW